MKYIILQSPSGLEIPVLFPDFIGHNDIKNTIEFSDVVSAGFCKPDCEGKISTWGESTTLKLKSEVRDRSLINRAFDIG